MYRCSVFLCLYNLKVSKTISYTLPKQTEKWYNSFCINPVMKLVQVFKSEMGERKPTMIGKNELDLVLSEFKHSTGKSQTIIMTIKSMFF